MVTGVPRQPALGDDLLENIMPDLDLPSGPTQRSRVGGQRCERRSTCRGGFTSGRRDFEEFGKGCLAKVRGAAKAIHSDACLCLAPMHKEMQAADEGRHARQLRDVHNRDIHEERATKRVKHDEVPERASSSGRAPCNSSACPANVDSELPASAQPQTFSCSLAPLLRQPRHFTSLPSRFFFVAVPAQCFRLCALIRSRITACLSSDDPALSQLSPW